MKHIKHAAARHAEGKVKVRSIAERGIVDHARWALYIQPRAVVVAETAEYSVTAGETDTRQAIRQGHEAVRQNS